MWNNPIVKIDSDNVATLRCKGCGNTFKLCLTPLQIHRLQEHDGLIQNILPDVKPAIRELFITGLCNDCWKKSLGIDLEEAQNED